MSTFREQLKQFFAKTFKGFYIEVTKPKKFLLDCGVPDLPIVITPANLTKKIEKHNLTKDDLQSLNTLLNSPLIVYHSQNQGKYYSAFSVITERKNNEGYLCVVIYINEKINKIEINNIASIHYRNINSLIKWCEENYLIDSNIEKCKKVFSGSCHNDSKFEYLLSLLDTAKLKQKNQNTKGLGKNISELSGISNSEMQSRELDIVIKARTIAQNGESLRSRFNAMLDLYENQPTIRPTDTKSKLFQQYSTPCPLAFLASEFVKQEGKRYYFEPSAGNGMLTISLPEQFTCVNELDEVRYKNLRKQGFCRVTQLDSSKKIDLYGGSFFDGVITNPPFKSLPKSEQEVRNGFNLATLDYKMAAVALDQMNGVGKAAVIVGGKLFDNYWKPVKGTDKKMLFGQWKVFLGWLYGQYNVVDVIYIGGDYIYRKQGTTYPVVLILINGRHIFDKNKHKPRYIFEPVKDKIIETYEQLFERVSPHLEKQQQEAYYSPLFDNLIKLLKTKPNK